MRQSLVPVLLLATVALSSSNVLSLLSIDQLQNEPVSSGQLNDNIFSNSYEPKNRLNDIYYTISIGAPKNDIQQSAKQLQYIDVDYKKPDDESNNLYKEDAYNGEGYRQKQWHNYPRQLDRLHEYLYEHHNADKRNLDPDDPEQAMKGKVNDIKPNEFQIATYNENGNEAIIADIDPFLIFKIRLALSDKFKNTNIYPDLELSEPEYVPGNKDESQPYDNLRDHYIGETKLKREELYNIKGTKFSENLMTKNRAVKKRIFSLWSRLQNINHKGHELPARRHFHAFYNLPDSEGGSAHPLLTAETRATFLRPPGSPLRWG